MPALAKPASILAIALLTAGAASADNGHHDRNASGPRMGADAMPMGGDRHDMMKDMMRMMMRMHGPDAMTPGMGPMGGHGMPGMTMMDRDMMRMIGSGMMDGMPQGAPGQMIQSRLEEYDSDGDGALNLEEFAAWHAAMMRERMVDRFQHLDADGDGAVTSEEMNAFADRLSRMRNDAMKGRPMMRDMPEQD